MADDLTVLLVGSFGPSDELSGLLEKQGIFGDTVATEELHTQLKLAEPSLVVHFGKEGADSTVREVKAAETSERRLRVVVVAERAELTELRKLDRTYVASLLATDMPDSVIAARISMLARKGTAKTIPPGESSASSDQAPPRQGAPQASAKKPPTLPKSSTEKASLAPKAPPRVATGGLKRTAPAPTASLPPRPGPPTPSIASPRPSLSLGRKAPPASAEGSDEKSGLLRGLINPAPTSTSAPDETENVTAKVPLPPPKQLATAGAYISPPPTTKSQALPSIETEPGINERVTAVPPPQSQSAAEGATDREVRALVADDDIMRGDRIAQALRERGIRAGISSFDPAATRWPLLRDFAPTILIVDGASIKAQGQIWYQLFRADQELGKVRMAAVIFSRMFNETTGAVDLRMLIPQMPQLSLDPHREPLPTLGVSLQADQLLASEVREAELSEHERPTWIHEEGTPLPLVAKEAEASELEQVADDEMEFDGHDVHAELTVVRQFSETATPPSSATETPQPTAASEPVLESVSSAKKGRGKVILLAAASVLALGAGTAYNYKDTLLSTATIASAAPTSPESHGESEGKAPVAEPTLDKAAAKEEPVAEEIAEEPFDPWRAQSTQPVPDCETLVTNLEELKVGGQGQATLSFSQARKALMLGDIEKAHLLMCEGALLFPESLAVEGLVELLLGKHAPERAKRWIDAAVAARPDRRKALELQGDVLSQLGQIEPALASWARSLKVEPQDQKTLIIVGQQYEGEGEKALRAADLTRAEQMLRRAVAMNPAGASGAAKLAQVFVEQYRAQKQPGLQRMAKAWAEKAIALEPNLGLPYVALADLAELDANQDEALGLYKKALEREPGNARANQQVYKLEHNQ